MTSRGVRRRSASTQILIQADTHFSEFVHEVDFGAERQQEFAERGIASLRTGVREEGGGGGGQERSACCNIRGRAVATAV